jgi:hypothetical protein
MDAVQEEQVLDELIAASACACSGPTASTIRPSPSP